MMFPFRASLFLGIVLVSLTTQAQQVLVLCEGAQDFYSGEVMEAPRLGRFDERRKRRNSRCCTCSKAMPLLWTWH